MPSKIPIHASESLQSSLGKMRENIPILNIDPLRETLTPIGCHVDFVQTLSASWTKKHLLKEVGCLKIVGTLRESCTDTQGQRSSPLVRYLRVKQLVWTYAVLISGHDGWIKAIVPKAQYDVGSLSMQHRRNIFKIQCISATFFWLNTLTIIIFYLL